MTYDCIIIGGGAAGLFCAAGFEKQVNGLILERSSQPGVKLLMSGSGQCNVTHGGSIKDFVPRYGKNGPRIRSCLYKYNNLHLQNFLRENGIACVQREDGKIFPASMDARQIRDMLVTRAKQNGFTLETRAEVVQVRQTADKLWQVTYNQKVSVCHFLIVASGGCSYPSTGSDGSFFQILKRDLNLPVTNLQPALTPVNVTKYPYSALSGIGLENVRLTVWRQQRKAAENTGSLLFTHENFSGPLILNTSKDILRNDEIKLNYIYPMSKTEALENIINVMQNTRMRLHNLLPPIFGLPKAMMQTILSETGDKPKAVAARLTEDSFTVKSLVGFSKAMVTSGGIDSSVRLCKR